MGPPAGPVIPKALGHTARRAAGKISSLEEKGLAERLRTASNGEKCDRIPLTGRAALEKEPLHG